MTVDLGREDLFRLLSSISPSPTFAKEQYPRMYGYTNKEGKWCWRWGSLHFLKDHEILELYYKILES